MKIKTIVHAIPEEFDAQVNGAMADGWHLVKRKRVDPTTNCMEAYYLYAELVKLDEEPTVTWQEAAQVLKSTCSESDTCDACKMRGWCDAHLAGVPEPQEWVVPTE